MSTKTWTNVFNMTTDAGFRTIGSNFSSNIQALNPSILTQTADTGQINWTTVTKPTVTVTSAGYEIYKFTDAIGTIYIKLEYGTGSSATTIFGMWITTGTGSDGAGNITGVLAARTATSNAGITGTTNSYPSYACCLNGAFWFLVGAGSNIGTSGNCQTFGGLARTCDSSGAATGDGYEVFSVSSTASNMFAINLSTLNVFTSSAGNHCLVPYNITVSNYGTGGNNIYQMWRHEIPLPQTLTTNFAACYVTSEAGTATTTTSALVGSTTHTYFFAGPAVVRGAQGSTSFSWVLIYE